MRIYIAHIVKLTSNARNPEVTVKQLNDVGNIDEVTQRRAGLVPHG